MGGSMRLARVGVLFALTTVMLFATAAVAFAGGVAMRQVTGAKAAQLTAAMNETRAGLGSSAIGATALFDGYVWLESHTNGATYSYEKGQSIYVESYAEDPDDWGWYYIVTGVWDKSTSQFVSIYESDSYVYLSQSVYADVSTSGLTVSSGRYQVVTFLWDDYFGEIADLESFNLTVKAPDVTPPTTSISGIPSAWGTAPVTFAVTASDSGSGVSEIYYQVGSQSPELYQGPVMIDTEGATTVSYWAIDQRGNTSAHKSATVRIDRTAPVTSASAALDAELGAEAITFVSSDAFPSGGAGCGVAKIQYRVDGGAWQLVPGDGVAIVSTAGDHVVEYQAVDKLNNVESAQQLPQFTVPVLAATSTSLKSSASTIGYNGGATLSACVRDVGGSYLPTATVRFERLSGSTWVSMGDVVTDLNGSAVMSVASLTSKQTYRARVLADLVLANGASTSANVSVTPRVSVGNPIAPATMYTSKYYTTYGFLKPRHTSGTSPVRIYKYRLVSGTWKPYGYVTAKASNYSTYTKYSCSLRLAYAGRWRLRAYSVADAGHAATWSSGYDYVTVK